MKKVILITILMCLTLVGCSNSNTEEETILSNNVTKQEDKFVALEKKEDTNLQSELIQPVPGQSYEDTLYDLSDKTTSDITEEVNTNEFAYDLSYIKEQEIKDLIVSIYNEEQYTSFEPVEYYVDSDREFDVINCIVKMNGTIYIISSTNGDARAIKDEYGVYDDNYGLDGGN